MVRLSPILGIGLEWTMRVVSSVVVGLLLGALAVGCSSGGGGSAPVGELAIDAGSLKLHVVASPWGMFFYDADDNLILAEHSATDTLPTGSVGLHLGPPAPGSGGQAHLPELVEGEPATPPARDEGWIHAVELSSSTIDGDDYVATLSTTDETRTLELRATAAADGVIAITVIPNSVEGVQALGIGFVSEDNERFVGFGERGNAVDQTGRAIENFVAEGPYQDNEYIFVSQLVPPPGLRWRQDTTYFPIPWLLSSRGYGVLLDHEELSYHRVGSEVASAWSMEVESTEMSFRVFGGPTPADALRRYALALGTQPSDYAPWFFGPWVQTDRDDRIDELRDADVPTSVASTYLHYLPCGAQQGSEDEQKTRTTALNAKGTAVHTYFNPMICVDYEPVFSDAEAQGALLKDGDGNTYVYEYSTSSTFDVSQFDFSSPNGVSAYKALTDEALSHGYEGWMEDFGEYTPLDAVDHDGVTGTGFHNRYVRDYHCGVFEATSEVGKPLARFVRSGWTGSAACSPIVWGGDPTVSFAFDGLESSIYQALSMGTSGVGVWGSDIGGFFALFGNSLSGELFDRWLAFGGLSVVMRSQKDGIDVPADDGRPQPWDELHLPIWRRYSKLHTQLYPYLQAAAEEYYATGMPIMRHHVLTHPSDANATGRDDQYMFGSEFLVAPVYREGATDREVYLPEGTWVEWWRSVDYVEQDGSFVLSEVALHDGLAAVTVSAPVDEIPMFVVAGAVIPMLAPDVWTLAEHGDDPSIVHASDREDQLHVIAFPRGKSAGEFYKNGSWTSEEAAGSWTLVLDGGTPRTIHLKASLRVLEQPFEPCAVTLDDTPISEDDWSYDSDTGVLEIRYETTSGTLVASTC